mgnify:CR=1 FL=1
MHFFTSVTACYIPKARVLAKTLKKYNEDAVMHLVISDDLPAGFDIGKEDFDYVWNFMQTSDHFYYMATKWFSDGDVHSYFNPYGSAYEAFINYMNVLADFEIELNKL